MSTKKMRQGHKVSEAEVIETLRSEIRMYRRSYDELDGKVRDKHALKTIACLKAAVRRLKQAEQGSALWDLIKAHAQMLRRGNHYAYFELAYTRQTEWMAWLCSKPSTDDPKREVIARGQGSTPTAACASALAFLDNEGGQS